MLGTNCSLKWREAAEKERLWNIEPGHPITQGIGEYIELLHAEMYGERFDIPTPDKIIFYNREIQKVIANAVRWARPRVFLENFCYNAKPIEKLK